jgi:hypothetical protein
MNLCTAGSTYWALQQAFQEALQLANRHSFFHQVCQL